jgi:hypothetical protein
LIKNLYIFEPTIDFSQIDSSSILLDRTDVDFVHVNYHTSLSDLTAQDICAIADKFDTITFIDQGFDKQSHIYQETVILLNFLQHSHIVINFAKNDPITFISNQQIYTRPNEPVLWTFGCSHSAGAGLDNFDQCYSSLLGRALNRPSKSIAKGGSSIEWSLRHLMQADLHPGDLVIWQITTPERFTRGVDPNGHVTEVLLKLGSLIDVEFFSDPQIFYHYINCFNIGLKFLRTQPIEFVVTSLNSDSNLYYDCITEFTKHPEYCYLPGFNVDLGNDNLHYGPISHKNLAEGILKFLKR